MCGVYLAHMYEIAGQPDNAQIVELGPGRGSLMVDMRQIWDHIMPTMADLLIQLVETSPQLRAIQKQRIKAASIAWHDDVQSLPNAAVFGVANEFFDALPIDQAVWRQGTWRHRLITTIHGALSFVDGPRLTAPELTRWQIANDRQEMTEGSIAEYCRAAELIMRQLAGRIARHGGACLIIDYGKNDNCSDSLQASAHKPVDLLYQPGNADISHWLILRHYAVLLLIQAHGLLALSHRQIFLWQLVCANALKMPRFYAMLMGGEPYLPRLTALLGRITWAPPLKWG